MRRHVGSVHAVSHAPSNRGDDNFKAATSTEQDNGATGGELDLSAKDLTPVVTGGTGKYRAVTGNLVATPAGRLAQHLVISLS